MVSFELVKECDANILFDIALRAFDDDYKLYGCIPPGIDSIDWHLEKIRDGLYYKIILDGKIIGGFKLFNCGKKHFQLGAIYIDPEFHNKGIGTQTIEFIEKTYFSVKKWTLDTPYKNYRNHHFYEKMGYKKTGEFKPDPKEDFCLFLYEKNI